MDVARSTLRAMLRGAYDIQKMRIQMGNRIAINFRAKLGQEPGTKEEDMSDKDAINILKKIKDDYTTMMEGITKFPTRRSFKGTAVISTYTELCLIQEFADLQRMEKEHFSRLGSVLLDFDIYTKFLKDVKGVGPAMAGVLVSEYDIAKATYVSSLWKYAGLDVAPDGRGRSRRKEHLVEVTYLDTKGVEQTRMSITFNPFLKTKLMGVLADSFLRAGNPRYREIYDNYKNRMENHAMYGIARDKPTKPATLTVEKLKLLSVDEKNEREKDQTKYNTWMEESKSPDFVLTSEGRRHNMSKRYMVKMFLMDLYKEWRAMENLPITPPYHEAKLGMVHGKGVAAIQTTDIEADAEHDMDNAFDEGLAA